MGGSSSCWGWDTGRDGVGSSEQEVNTPVASARPAAAQPMRSRFCFIMQYLTGHRDEMRMGFPI